MNKIHLLLAAAMGLSAISGTYSQTEIGGTGSRSIIEPSPSPSPSPSLKTRIKTYPSSYPTIYSPPAYPTTYPITNPIANPTTDSQKTNP